MSGSERGWGGATWEEFADLYRQLLGGKMKGEVQRRLHCLELYGLYNNCFKAITECELEPSLLGAPQRVFNPQAPGARPLVRGCRRVGHRCARLQRQAPRGRAPSVNVLQVWPRGAPGGAKPDAAVPAGSRPAAATGHRQVQGVWPHLGVRRLLRGLQPADKDEAYGI